MIILHFLELFLFNGTVINYNYFILYIIYNYDKCFYIYFKTYVWGCVGSSPNVTVSPGMSLKHFWQKVYLSETRPYAFKLLFQSIVFRSKFQFVNVMRASYEDQFFHAPIDVSKCQVSNFNKYLFVFAIIHMQVVFCQLFVSVSFIYLLLLLWLWLLLFYFKDCRESSFHIINIFFFIICHLSQIQFVLHLFMFSNIRYPISIVQFPSINFRGMK